MDISGLASAFGGSILVAAVGAPITRGIQRRRVKRQVAEGLLPVSLRLIDGDCEGLSGRWRRGTAIPAAAGIMFVPDLGGPPLWPEEEMVLEVTDDAVLAARRPTSREIWTVDVGGRIVVCTISAAVVELAASEVVLAALRSGTYRNGAST